MSTRAEFQSVRGLEAAQARTCSACGTKDWTAFWMGVHDIVLCRACAGTAIAQLTADAVWYPRLEVRDAELALAQFSAEFWRAIAVHALRARDPQ